MRRLLFVALLVAGCQRNFDPASYLAPGELRVVAVTANPPEVAPGESSQIEIILAPLPDGTTPTFAWDLCLDPPLPGSAQTNNDCFTHDTAPYLQPIPGDQTAMVTMPPFTNPLMYGIPDNTSGVYLPVKFRITAGAQSIMGAYKLRMTVPGFPVNHNPQIQDLYQVVNGVAVPLPRPFCPVAADGSFAGPCVEEQTSVPAGAQVILRASLLPGSDESYKTYTGNPTDPSSLTFTTKVEEPRFFWYSDAGSFSDDITGDAQPDTTLDLSGAAMHPAQSGQVVHVYLVVHDPRGGVAWTRRILVVE